MASVVLDDHFQCRIAEVEAHPPRAIWMTDDEVHLRLWKSGQHQGIGSAEGSADVEGAVFAYGNGHVADLEAFEPRSARRILSTCG
jgi:hypothetical protein